MTKTNNQFLTGLLLITGLTLVMISCQKEQHNHYSHVPAETNANAVNPMAAANSCTSLLPDSLQVPEGNKLAYETYASGVQIYQVRRSATDPNVFSWVNIAPSADLYLKPDFTQQVGIHYAGPSWEFTKGPYKGEKVVATKLKGATIDPGAIQWLLLKAVESLSSPGNKVTYLQRICTAGGLAPATIPNESNLGRLDSIPYTTVYRFYEKK